MAERLLSKEKILTWADRNYPIVAYYDTNSYTFYSYSKYEALIAVGARAELLAREQAWSQSEAFLREQSGQWIFGGLSYELKNELERLSSANFDGLDFPLLHLFVPEHLFLLHKTGEWEIVSETPADLLLRDIATTNDRLTSPELAIALQPRIHAATYRNKVRSILSHIAAGDVYELNFCQEFFAEEQRLDSPLSVFRRLNALAQAPFSAYYKNRQYHLLSASPERFLYRDQQRLVSQPIKGTARRGKSPEEDLLAREELFESPKDRAENVMIVDLVRNDLARSCAWGSVRVEELFRTYPFPTVWQLISTVSGELRPDVSAWTALQRAFPMGSMTGAPKVMAMQLIEEYEETRRGWYSGSVGYIAPNGDFDWNVVIRSLFYNAQQHYLSFQVGGAIVYDSVPESEYEECLLKAQNMLKVLGML